MARARRGRLSGPRPTSAKRCTCSWKNPRARRGYMGRAGSGHNCEVLNMVAARKGNHRHLVILRKVTEPTILLPICGRSSSSRATIARLARARSFVRRESEPLRAQRRDIGPLMAATQPSLLPMPPAAASARALVVTNSQNPSSQSPPSMECLSHPSITRSYCTAFLE